MAVMLIMLIIIVTYFSFNSWYNSLVSSEFIEINDGLSANKIEILNLNSTSIIIKNKNPFNINITQITINSQNCTLNKNVIAQDITNLALNSSCLKNVNIGQNDIFLYTNTSNLIISKYFLETEIKNLDCNDASPGYWIKVPGNEDLGVEDFCVMQFEAKATTSSLIHLYNSTEMHCGNGALDGGNNCPTDGRVKVTSARYHKPLVYVYQTEAKTLCQNLGDGYDLISDPQWVTIARNIESVDSNWVSGTVGDNTGGGIKKGNVGVSAPSSTNEGEAVDRDSNLDPKANLVLTNGESIWDFSGNVYEWTSNVVGSNVLSALGQGSGGWKEWTQIAGFPDIQSINSTYNSFYGVGKVLVDVDDASPSGTTHAFLRGGYYASHSTNSLSGGIYTLMLTRSPLDSGYGHGFRCVYSLN